MKRKKLLIISHTEHYRDGNQEIVGLGSTVNEINFLADYWEEVVHVGCFYPSKAPKSALPYTKSSIRFVPIPPFGGKSFLAKLLILLKIPTIIRQVVKNSDGASEVQLRLPTSIGLFLLPLFSFFLPRNYTFWVKYAGNWGQAQPPFSYRLQRYWLLKNWARCGVTLNGFWNKQPYHCYSFENPCLSELDLEKGKVTIKTKNFQAPFILTFIGRLEDEKGVSTIIEALKTISLDKIDAIHFIGDGVKRRYYEKQASFLGSKVFFHGFLSKDAVHSILSESHFFLLPSDSEGFPKTVAEAACYGVLPVVSDVGSIGHYINATNGFVWYKNEETCYRDVLEEALNTSSSDLKEKSNLVQNLVEKFTFMAYLNKLNHLILKD